MSQTAITYAFEQWKAQQAANGVDVVLDEFVFANVPGLDVNVPVNRAEMLPATAMIVHRQAVTKTGLVNQKGVVYSVVLGATTGDFDFNWIGLINRASGTLAMVVHAPFQKKISTAAGQQGNVLTRSFLMEYNGAANETAINTPADTWQIDFTARLDGADERIRVENIDTYGSAAFFGDGYLVTRNGAQYHVTGGVGYVAGLRTELPHTLDITVTTKPVYVWIDVAWRGALTSVWSVESKITVAASLADYEQNGFRHRVFAVARIEADGSVIDLRPKESLDRQWGESHFLQKGKNLSDLTDSVAARQALNLKGAALLDVGSQSGTVAAGDDSRIINALQKGSNLSDLTDTKKARSALGLKGAALLDVGNLPGTVAAGDDSRIVNALQVATAPLSVDLNQLGSRANAGVYFQEIDANALAALHYPAQLSGTLTVTPTAFGCVQEYTTYAQSRKFVRGLAGPWNGNGPWSPWAELYSENHKPAPSEIGAVPASGGKVGYLEDADHYFTAVSKRPIGAGAYENQLNTEAPFYVPDWQWTPDEGGLYVPMIKGKSTRKGQGWPTAVSFGYLMRPGNGSLAFPIIQVQGDGGVKAAWTFDPVAKTLNSDGGFFAGDARFYNNGDCYGAIWGGALSGWLSSSFSLRDQNISARALTSTVNQQVATLNNTISTKADSAWVNRYFINDIALGAQGAFAVNNPITVPGGCVMTGWLARDASQGGDAIYYRPIQKYYPAIGWVTIGHNA